MKKWVRDVLVDKDRIADVIGLPIGEMLGCGHWGCVFESEPPWVVKFSRDPTEGPIWAKLIEWVKEQNETVGVGTDGLARAREVVQLSPGVVYRGKERELFVIVREAVAPLFSNIGGVLALTPASIERLGLTSSGSPYEYAAPEAISFYELEGIARDFTRGTDKSNWAYNAYTLMLLLKALRDYQELAYEWHAKRSAYSREHFEDQMMRAASRMTGWIGNPISETLIELLGDGMVLRDVHWMNIGWRVHSEVLGEELPETLVIFDPGHTPTKGAAPPTAMRRNSSNDTLTLYHGSYSPVRPVPHLNEGEELFDGIFASDDEEVAKAHGKYVHEYEVPEDLVLTQGRLWSLAAERNATAVVDRVLRDEAAAGADIERLWELVIEEEEPSESDIALFRLIDEDLAHAGWEAQRIRGRVAVALGYAAIEMHDEHGTSYLIVARGDGPTPDAWWSEEYG